MRLHLLLLLLTMVPVTVFAKSESAATSAPILLIPLGTRALGMGAAFTAVADNPSALYYNPAGLSRLDHHELDLAFFSGSSDNDQQYVAYGGPLKWTGLSGNGYASMGASVLSSRKGTIEVTELNANGSVARAETISAGNDIVATVGYAERVGMTPIGFGSPQMELSHFIGVNGKFIYSSLVEKFTATTFAADIGYLITEPSRGLALGFSVLNLGSGLKFIETKDPLPLSFRLGLAYDWIKKGPHKLLVSNDTDFLFNERQWHSNLGFEYTWKDKYAARVGHLFKQETLGFTAGLGFKWRPSIAFDYAWALGSGLSDLHRLTFAYSFGEVQKSVRSKQRRPFIESVPDRRRLPNVDQEVPRVQRPRPRRRVPQQRSPDALPGWIY